MLAGMNAYCSQGPRVLLAWMIWVWEVRTKSNMHNAHEWVPAFNNVEPLAYWHYSGATGNRKVSEKHIGWQHLLTSAYCEYLGQIHDRCSAKHQHSTKAVD